MRIDVSCLRVYDGDGVVQLAHGEFAKEEIEMG
jgi:hypothetical protein